MSTQEKTLIQRVRHPFRSRHVQLLKRETLTPSFVRLTLGGEALHDFKSDGFDDHVKLILPHEDLERPNLPKIVDGKPHTEEPRSITRDYTPLNFDPVNCTLQMDFVVQGDGPAASWARSAPIGQWLGLAGPRGSMLLPEDLQWQWLFGDESAMPAIERRLAELPANTRAVVRVQLNDAADQRSWQSAAELDLQWVDSLAEAADALEIPQGHGFIWAAGENRAMAALRKQLLAKPGAEARRMRIASYWKQGESGHHKVIDDGA